LTPSPAVRAPEALLFDLDGTLVDSRGDIAAACNAALRAHGRAPLALDAIMPMVGDGARALVARAFGLREDEPLVTDALASFKASYLASPCVHTTLLPGAREALAVGVPCALVTNKPRDVTELVLAALGLAGAFAFVWAGGDGPLKPAPDSVLAAVRALGVAAEDAWMIGDGPQDVAAARAAGAVAVAVPGIADRERVLAASPDLVARSLTEVAELARRARGATGY